MALTIHVGAHKTASTHLQQTLRAFSGPMLRAGIHYLDIRHLRHDETRLDGALGQAKGAAIKRRLWKEHFDTAVESFPDVIVSEENILGWIRREGLMGDDGVYPRAAPRVDRMCAVLRRRPATLMLAVREPVSFLRSAFSMQVEGGFELEFSDYIGAFDPAALSWSGLAKRLLQVAGVRELVVWRYEDYPAVRPVLLNEVLPPALAARAPNPARAVVGMSQLAFDEIRRRMADDPQADQIVVVAEAKARFPRGKSAGPLQIGDSAMITRAKDAYVQDIADLARMDGVRLLG